MERLQDGQKSKLKKVAANDSIIITVGTQSWNCYYDSKDWVCSNVESVFFVPGINRLYPCTNFFYENKTDWHFFSLEKLFVPIRLHREDHWCLAVSKLTLILELEYNNLRKSSFFHIINNSSHHEVLCAPCKIQWFITDKNTLLK